ncbi:MAG: spore maturation protein A [Clostridia bacterium]|nr:spore maturation protein A [Clostridia bacterium]
MLGKSFAVFVLLSVVFSVVTGNTDKLSAAALEGASDAIRVALSLAGMMCLWSGIMRVLYDAGITKRLSRFASFILRRLFPRAFESGSAKEEITSSLLANFLGVGNAATPLALSAMKKLDGEHRGIYATDDMIMLALTSVSPLSLIPTTVIALRQSGGARDPTDIMIPVWISSLAAWLFTVALAKLNAALFPIKEGRQR